MTVITAAVRERPIAFSAEMVRAILADRKTQTRRVVVPQPMRTPGKHYEYEPSDPVVDVNGVWHFKTGPSYYDHNDARCPYGQPGDRLWVREAWCIGECGSRVSIEKEAWPRGWPTDHLQYPATDTAPAVTGRGEQYWWGKRSSLRMPRWASRMTLEVTGVRLERVQDISEEDAKAEGIQPHYHLGLPSHQSSYRELWDSLNAKRGYAWDANPWVWVVEFTRAAML